MEVGRPSLTSKFHVCSQYCQPILFWPAADQVSSSCSQQTAAVLSYTGQCQVSQLSNSSNVQTDISLTGSRSVVPRSVYYKPTATSLYICMHMLSIESSQLASKKQNMCSKTPATLFTSAHPIDAALLTFGIQSLCQSDPWPQLQQSSGPSRSPQRVHTYRRRSPSTQPRHGRCHGGPEMVAQRVVKEVGDTQQLWHEGEVGGLWLLGCDRPIEYGNADRTEDRMALTPSSLLCPGR